MHVRTLRVVISLISLTLILCALLPASVRAGVFSDILAKFAGEPAEADALSDVGNIQTMPLLRPAMNVDPSGRGGGDITIVDDSALMPVEGPSGTLADIQKPHSGTISRYVVHSGDTLNGIAKMFGVTANTILWANNLPRGSVLQVGQTLIILPVTGIQYTVKTGDTFASIAKKYGGEASDIQDYNGIDELTVGDTITVPGGELAPPPLASHVIGAEPAHNVGPRGTPEEIGYYLRPIIGGVRTQGIHGYNGVDLGGVPIGTPIMAAAEGDVVVARQGGWNGGYGSYVVITHGNGSQTLYAHMSHVSAYDGQHVVKGQVIGTLGNTGKSTGPHVHFEIRNGIRNPF